MPKHRLIGLTGTNGAGKGEVAAYLAKKSYAYFSLSDIIREKLEEEDAEANRDNLIRKGNELRRKGGPDILARLVMERVRGKAVIDSIRNPREVEYLKKQAGFILLAIDAPPSLRFERVQKRGRNESAQTLDEFIQKEAEENGGDTDAQQLRTCMEMADRTISNDGTLEDLYRKLEELS